MYSPPPRHRPSLPFISPLSPESIGVDLITSQQNGGSGTWPAANRAIFIPVYLSEPFTVVKMWVSNGSAVSGNVDVGIYDAGLSRLVSSGSTAQAGTSVIQEFDITDTTLAPGRYYMALALSATLGTTWRFPPNLSPVKATGAAQMSSAFPLPSTATLETMASAYIPTFGLSSRTVVA